MLMHTQLAVKIRCECDTMRYVLHRDLVGGQEYVVELSEIEKGATADDMKVTSQLCTS